MEFLFVAGRGRWLQPRTWRATAALLLRVARLKDQLTDGLPFVEDRLDNMETVVAALHRTIDTYLSNFEVC